MTLFTNACAPCFNSEGLFGEGVDFDVLYNAIDLERFSFNAEACAQARADLGLFYVKKCGLWIDFRPIAQTVGCVLTAQGN